MPHRQKINVSTVVVFIVVILVMGLGVVGVLHNTMIYLRSDIPLTETPLHLFKIYMCIIAPIIMVLAIYIKKN